LQQAMLQKGEASWLCMIGNNRRWKEGVLLLSAGGITLTASRVRALGDAWEVGFSWTPRELSFAELLEQLGHIPLPPYMHRPDSQLDAERYQTVFARYDGSVAAPTASLHFSEHVLAELKHSGIEQQELTLHVGAGTFKPVKAATMAEHDMHREELLIDTALIDRLLTHDGPIIPVGTTALRCVESLYWMGALLLKEDADLPEIHQFTPYEFEHPPTIKEALTRLKHQLTKLGDARVPAFTALMIAPGYQFRIADALITNFHQPNSTLLLLVSAAIGNAWKQVYEHALANDYRFLSYGDSSLLWIDSQAKTA